MLQSSFLGRGSNHSLPSSRKHGLGTVRSIIFGRGGSNSRSTSSVLEDSSDTVGSISGIEVHLVLNSFHMVFLKVALGSLAI